MASVAFGSLVQPPATVASRSLCIQLFASPHPENYEVLYPDDEEMCRPFTDAKELIEEWASTANLTRKPEMPAGLRGRFANKWTPLLSIAESFGPEWAERAREAAFASRDEFAGMVVQQMMLLDCETVFDQHGGDRIRSEDLLDGLLELTGRYSWDEYRGSKDDGSEHKLRIGEMSALLRLFQIHPKKIRFDNSKKGSLQGYYRADFERHWDGYRTKAGTPEQKLKLITGGKIK